MNFRQRLQHNLKTFVQHVRLRFVRVSDAEVEAFIYKYRGPVVLRQVQLGFEGEIEPAIDLLAIRKELLRKKRLDITNNIEPYQRKAFKEDKKRFKEFLKKQSKINSRPYVDFPRRYEMATAPTKLPLNETLDEIGGINFRYSLPNRPTENDVMRSLVFIRKNFRIAQGLKGAHREAVMGGVVRGIVYLHTQVKDHKYKPKFKKNILQYLDKLLKESK